HRRRWGQAKASSRGGRKEPASRRRRFILSPLRGFPIVPPRVPTSDWQGGPTMFRYVAWGSLLCVLAGPLSARAQSTGKPFSLAPIGSPPAATAENSSAGSEKVQWRSPRKGTPPLAIRPQATTAAGSSTSSGGTIDVSRVRSRLNPSAARVTSGDGTLPVDRGQVWREYDISPYTSQVTNAEKLQQAIVDWLLRESGNDLWFTDA